MTYDSTPLIDDEHDNDNMTAYEWMESNLTVHFTTVYKWAKQHSLNPKEFFAANPCYQYSNRILARDIFEWMGY